MGGPLPFLDQRLCRVYRTTSQTIAILAVVVGLAVLAGWTFDVSALTRFIGSSSMKANTAVLFVLSGVALYLLDGTRTKRRREVVATVLAIIVLAIASLSLLQDLAGVSLGIDELLFDDPGAPVNPGRMALLTSVAFVLHAASIVGLSARRHRIGQALALAVFGIGFSASIGYLFHARSLYTVGTFTSVAVHTGVMLALLGVGTILARPERGPVSMLASSGAAGRVMRRLLPAALIGPLVVGAIVHAAHDAARLDPVFGLAIEASSLALLFSVLIVTTAMSLRHAGSVVDHSPDAVYSHDRDGIIHSWNAAAERLLGYKPSEIIGRPVDILVPDEAREDVVAAREDVFAGRSVGDLETKRRAKGGKIVEVALSLSPWFDDEGRVTGAWMIARDITARKEAERALRHSEKRTRAILDALPVSVSLFDRDGRKIYSNAVSKAFWGDDQNRHYTDLLARIAPRVHGSGKPYPEGDEPLVSALGGRATHADDIVVTLADGREAVMEVWAEPIKDEAGGVAEVIVASTDVTMRRQAEDAVRHALEQERQIAERLRELDEMKSELVGTIAHDLQNPLSVVAAGTATLIQRWELLPDDQKVELLRAVSRNALRISGFVEDMLQVARIESGDVEPRVAPFDIAVQLAEMIGEMRLVMPDRMISLDVEPGLPRALADAELNGRVVSNLLSNAVKYSDARSEIRVTVEQDGDQLIVSVHDRGRGIPPSLRKHLFQKFSRLERVDDVAVQGTGLGLYVCRSLVEAQGGRIWVESEVGVGSTFSYTLPAEKVPAAQRTG